VCCSVLQYVAALSLYLCRCIHLTHAFITCCSVLQCVAVCCSVLQCVAVCCSVLQCAAVCCSTLTLSVDVHVIPMYRGYHRGRCIHLIIVFIMCCSALQYGAALSLSWLMYTSYPCIEAAREGHGGCCIRPACIFVYFQCVAVCCNVLLYLPHLCVCLPSVCCSVLQCVAVCRCIYPPAFWPIFIVLQCVAVCCSMLQFLLLCHSVCHCICLRVSNPIPDILVCDPIPRILEIEMPAMGSCSRSAKWAWDRLGGSCNTPLLECRNLYLHTGLVRTSSGSILEPPVPALKEGCVAAAAQTIPCLFC